MNSYQSIDQINYTYECAALGYETEFINRIKKEIHTAIFNLDISKPLKHKYNNKVSKALFEIIIDYARFAVEEYEDYTFPEMDCFDFRTKQYPDQPYWNTRRGNSMDFRGAIRGLMETLSDNYISDMAEAMCPRYFA